jgi:hypothetical protein
MSSTNTALRLLLRNGMSNFIADNMSNVVDDFYGDSDDYDALNSSPYNVAHQTIDEHGELSLRESAAIERQYFAIGYHETYDECHEASLQNGFDDGYRENYDNALHIGQLLGKFAIRVEGSKKSWLELNRTVDISSSVLQTTPETMLTDISHRVRSVLLSITQNEASREKSNTKDDYLQTAYDGVNVDIQQTSTQAAKQQRLRQLKDLEALAEDITTIVNDEATYLID